MNFDTSFPKNAEKKPIACIGMFSFTATVALLSENSSLHGTLDMFTAGWLDHITSDAIWRNMPPNSPVFALRSGTARSTTCCVSSTPQLQKLLNTGSAQENKLITSISQDYVLPGSDMTMITGSSLGRSPSRKGSPVSKNLLSALLTQIAHSDYTGSQAQLLELAQNVKAFGCD